MANDLKDRTKRFALDALRFCSTLPAKPEFRVIANHLMRAGTSVGANYRAACRSKSKADFINKLSIVEEEADECGYWFELLEDLACQTHPNFYGSKAKPASWSPSWFNPKKLRELQISRIRPNAPGSQFEIRNSKFLS